MTSMPNEIKIIVENRFIELQALMTERKGMVTHNTYSSRKYVEADFTLIAEKMRALKTPEDK